MMGEPGVYRVIYDLPGSLGSFQQQFIYNNTTKSVRTVAKNKVILKDSERYNIKLSRINIKDIKYIRYISNNQKRLSDKYEF